MALRDYELMYIVRPTVADDEFAQRVDRGYAVARSQCCELVAAAEKVSVNINEQGTCAVLEGGVERRLNLGFATRR